MSPDLPVKIVHKIEAICELGCAQVNQLLENAKNGGELEEFTEFTPSEIKLIIKELTHIMSVYDGKCSPEKK